MDGSDGEALDVGAVQILEKCLGRGAFGSVHLGVHTETGQNVAVKCLTFPTCENKKAKRQLEDSAAEIRLMQELNHPCIVQYLGAKRDGWDLFIFMEYVSGGTLKTLIGNMGTLSPTLSKKLLTCVLLGLNYLHSLSICHRDVKSENILLTGDGRAKLGDFGTSKYIQDCFSLCSGLKSVVGTPWFMAPEVINGENYGLPVDIWSVGCVCYEMVTGQHPYHEFNNLTAVMYHIARDRKPPSFPDALGAVHQEFMLCCFQGEPRDRMRTEELLEHPYLRGPSTGSTKARPGGGYISVPPGHPIKATQYDTTGGGSELELGNGHSGSASAPSSRPVSAKEKPQPPRDPYDEDPEVLNVTDDGVAVITLRSQAPADEPTAATAATQRGGGRMGMTIDGAGFIGPGGLFGGGAARPAGSAGTRSVVDARSHPQPPTPVRSVVEDPVVGFFDATPTPQRRPGAAPTPELEPESPGFGALPCCTVCRKAIAVFMCEQCSSGTTRVSFCPSCWDAVHDGDPHRKSPLLFNQYTRGPAVGGGGGNIHDSPTSPALLMESGRCVDFATTLHLDSGGGGGGGGGCAGDHPGACSYDNDGHCRFHRDALPEWACRYCTYLNPSGRTSCEVCERAR